MQNLNKLVQWAHVRVNTATVRGDRGEGPVSYIAILLLIALVAAALISLKVPNTIATDISNLVNDISKGKSPTS